MRPVKHQYLIPAWFLFAFLEGVAAVGLFLRLPVGSENAWLFGFSKARLVFLGGMVGTLILLGILAYHAWRHPDRSDQLADRLKFFLKNKYIYGLIAGISILGAVLSSQFFHFSGVVSDPYVQGYLVRLRPLFLWASGLAFQTLITLPLFRYGFAAWKQRKYWATFRMSAVITLILCVLGILAAATGIGIEPDLVGWDAPGTPILSTQVGFVLLAGILFTALETWASRYQKNDSIRFDLLISLCLWGLAFFLWFKEPLTPDYFAPDPRPPNYSFYPYSDAALHDVQAQALLIGEGFMGIARKPLYSLFLALLHAIGGQDYMNIIHLQVGILAALPVVIYWLTKRLHHRLSGFLAGGLIILREQNAISLSGEIRVSHSKLLMSDLPATLAVVILTWMLVSWLQDPERKRVLPIGIGGVSGLLMLLRPQFGLLVPLIFILVFIVYHRRIRRGISGLGLITLGFILTLSPWLWRSYQLSGKFTLNDPNQMAFLTEQYHFEPQTWSLQRQPGEALGDFDQRISDYVRDFITENPEYVSGFISAHFAHNQIEMLQVLPMSFWAVSNPDSDLFPHWRQYWAKLWKDCCSVHAYVEVLGFWDPEPDRIKPDQYIPIIVNLALISLGLAVAWRREDLIGWIPLGFSLVYSFSTAVGRYSGWRLILPADWVVFVYYAMGLGQAFLWLRDYFSQPRLHVVEDQYSSKSWQRVAMIDSQSSFPLRNSIALMIMLFLAGLAPLIVEAVVPPRYMSRSEKELISSLGLYSEYEIERFLVQDAAVVVEGRALYPRFYRAREGEPGSGWWAFRERDFARLGFFVIGPERANVILPLETSPDWFPHASDIIVVGCQEEDLIEAALVWVSSGNGSKEDLLVHPSFEELTCPLNPP